MATEQYFRQGVGNHEGNEDRLPPHASGLSSAITSLDSPSGCFDCNICLDNAHDPVVTLCGHLYCWPCIYKWLHFQGAASLEQCPVCKAEISQTTLVPLYGRGHSSQNEPKNKGPLKVLDIPNRPRACGVQDQISTTTSTSSASHRIHGNPYTSQSPGQQHYPNSFATPPSILPPSTLHPIIGMFGEMVYTRVFGNSQGASLHWYPDRYRHMRTTSPRMRRQEMQAEKSLDRISIFLFCCFVLCLLLF